EENLAEVIDDIELIRGDIRDYDTVTKAVAGVDRVLHQAALPSVPKSVADPVTANEVNITGTLNVLEASRQAGVKRFVMASSCAVYGDSQELPKHEGMMPAPLSPYAVGKLCDEYYCKVYWTLYQFPTVVLRYFNVFGPRQDPKSEYAAVIPRFIARLHDGEQPIVFGDGEQSRDFVYVDNVVAANLLACEQNGMLGGVFNVGAGTELSLNQLLDKLRAIMHVDIPARYDPPRTGDIRRSYADNSALLHQGFKLAVDLDEGLRRTVAYFTS
ncbi:MAG: NAD-dependent epimerase/dehydratase family protein, partial [Candidatus Zixiibacteriota bacterium]